MALRKTIAVWLLLLALSPFTAPFSTCDLSTFSLAHAASGVRVGKLSPLSETLIDEALAELQSSESPVAGRTRFLIHSEAAALLHAPVALGLRDQHPFNSARVLSGSTSVTRLRI